MRRVNAVYDAVIIAPDYGVVIKAALYDIDKGNACGHIGRVGSAALGRDACEHCSHLEEFALKILRVCDLADHVDVIGPFDLLDVVPNALLGAVLEGHNAVFGAVIEVVAIRRAFMRILRRAHADDAVVFPPALVDGDVAGGVVFVAAHVGRALFHERIYVAVGQVVVRINRAAVGIRAGDGEVVNVILRLGVGVEHRRAVRGQVVNAQILYITFPQAAVFNAVNVAFVALTRFADKTPLIKLEVKAEVFLVDVHARRCGKSSHEAVNERLLLVVDLAVILAAVVRRAECGDALYPVAAGAGEELADAAVGRCAQFVGIAVFKKLREHAYRLAAHAVADKVDLQRAVGVVKLGQNALEGAAVAAVSVLRRVVLAVIDRAADEVGVQLAGSVPVARNGAYRRGVDLVACVGEHLLKAGKAAPVVKVRDLRSAPAEQTVDEHDRVIVAVVG